MKKLLLAIFLLTPLFTFSATAVPWNTPTAGTGYIIPNLVNGVIQKVWSQGDLAASSTAWINGTTTVGESNNYFQIGKTVVDGLSNPVLTIKCLLSPSISDNPEACAFLNTVAIFEDKTKNTNPTFAFVAADIFSTGNVAGIQYATSTKTLEVTASTTSFKLGSDIDASLDITHFPYLGSYLLMLKHYVGGTILPVVADNGFVIKEEPVNNANPSLLFADDTLSQIGIITYGTSTGAFDITSQATTTASKGIDISTGCYAIAGTCISGSGTNYWTYVDPFLTPASSSPILGRDWPIYTLADTFPGLFMASLDGSRSASILYSSSTDVLNFGGASGGYNFDGPVNIDGATRLATSLTGFLKATAGVVSTSLIDLTTDVTGILPLAKGGTATSTWQSGSVVFSDGTKLTEDRPNFNWDDTNNRLGIGTTSPQSNLSIGAEAGVSPFAIGSSTKSLIYVSSSGFVGFGETNPLRQVVIRTDLGQSITTLANYNANTTDGNAAVNSFRSDTTGVGAATFQEFAAIRGEATIHDHATRVGTLRLFVQDGSTLKQPLTLQKGNVGVSSSTPNWPLSVEGIAQIHGFLQVGDISNFNDLDKAMGQFTTTTNSYAYLGIQNKSNGSTASTDFVWGNDNKGTPYTYYADCGLNSSGNTDPLYTGLGGSNAFYCYNSDGSVNFAAATTSSSGFFSFLTGGLLSNNRKMVIYNNGNVGIGATTTTDVDTLLTVGTSTSATTVNALKLYAKGFNLGDHPLPCLTFSSALSTLAPNSLFDGGRLCGGVPGTGSGYGRARIIGQLPTAAGTFFDAYTVGQNSATPNSSVNFGIASSTPWATLAVNPTAGDANEFVVGSSTKTDFIINKAGDVGIGTTSPKVDLDILGTTTVNNATTNMSFGVWPFGGTNRSAIIPADNTSADTDLLLLGGSSAYVTNVGTNHTNENAHNFTLGFYDEVSGKAGSITFSTSTIFAPTSMLKLDPGSANVINLGISGTGRAGVATTTPWAYFSVNPSNQSAGAPSFVVGSSTKTDLLVDQGGNVGIGSTSPNYRLTVNNPSTGIVARFGITGDPTLDIYQNNSSAGIGQRTSLLTYGSSFEIFDQSNVASRLWIASTTGNVGLATTTPFANFAINPVAGRASNQFVVGSSTATAFTITNGGLVGLGTTSPTRSLTIANPGRRGELLLLDRLGAFNDTTTQGGTYVSTEQGVVKFQGMRSDGSGSSVDLAIDQVNHRVGVSTTTPWKTLSLDGTMAINPTNLTTNTGASTYSLCLGSTGEVTKNSDAETCIASSRRFKQNIKYLVSGLNEVLKLKPAHYEMRPEKNNPGIKYGFIAEDVQEELGKEFVSHDAQGLPDGINWSYITTLNTKAIQELNTKIDNLQLGKVAVEAKRSAEENYQDLAIAILALVVIYQGYLIRRK